MMNDERKSWRTRAASTTFIHHSAFIILHFRVIDLASSAAREQGGITDETAEAQ
jgi:hypothetical protein